MIQYSLRGISDCSKSLFHNLGFELGPSFGIFYAKMLKDALESHFKITPKSNL